MGVGIKEFLFVGLRTVCLPRERKGRLDRSLVSTERQERMTRQDTVLNPKGLNW
jgi:hypothetical protein